MNQTETSHSLESGRPWVVKLGGSLARSPRLKSWLEALAEAGAPIVIVPGGGPFADQVRDSQEYWKFDESSAHAMALLAMEQFGRLLAALEPGLRLCVSLDDVRIALDARRVAVWLPQAMALGHGDIAESWDVTSDSLAAWFAGQLQARGVILVKSADPPAGQISASELSRLDLVDAAFEGYLAGSLVEAWCIGAGRHAEAARALADGAGPGTRIVTGNEK